MTLFPKKWLFFSFWCFSRYGAAWEPAGAAIALGWRLGSCWLGMSLRIDGKWFLGNFFLEKLKKSHFWGKRVIYIACYINDSFSQKMTLFWFFVKKVGKKPFAIDSESHSQPTTTQASTESNGGTSGLPTCRSWIPTFGNPRSEYTYQRGSLQCLWLRVPRGKLTVLPENKVVNF